MQNGGKDAAGTDLGQKNTAETAAELTEKTNMERYRKEVDGVFTGELPSGVEIILGETPKVLTDNGAPGIGLHMTQSVARKIAYPDGYFGGKHNLGLSVLKNLPYQLENPLAIVKNPQANARGLESNVVITEWTDHGGNQVIVPIHFNAQGAIELKNDVASAFGADYLRTILGKDNCNVVYTKNGEDINQLLSNKRPMPEAMADDIFSVASNVAQAAPEVNTEDMQNHGNSIYFFPVKTYSNDEMESAA